MHNSHLIYRVNIYITQIQKIQAANKYQGYASKAVSTLMFINK